MPKLMNILKIQCQQKENNEIQKQTMDTELEIEFILASQAGKQHFLVDEY